MAIGFTGEIHVVDRPESSPDSVDSVEIAAQLRLRFDVLVARQLACARTYASYADVPDEELECSLARNTERFIAIVEGVSLPDPLVDGERAIAMQRAAAGVIADDVVSLFRECTGILRDVYIEVAGRSDVDNSTVIAKLAELWEHSDRFTHVLADAWSYAENDRARRAERARVEFLQRLLLGTVTASELVALGPALGIRPHERYWVFRAQGTASELVAATRQIEATARQAGNVPLLGPIDGDLVGISVAAPHVLDEFVLALAGPVKIVELPHAFAEASRTLTVASRFGHRGVVTTRSLGIKLAVASENELGSMFVEKYVAPVLASGVAGESILQTVKVHLDSHCRYEVTAQATFAHPNTVRNRLRRFEELTGVDFDDFERRLEIWWAVQYWQITTAVRR